MLKIERDAAHKYWKLNYDVFKMIAKEFNYDQQ